MKKTCLAWTAAVALALAAPPVIRDEWPIITLPYPAAPVPTSDPSWQPALDQVCLYMTNDYNWSGYGVNLCMTSNQCSSKVPDSLSANISSAGPNEYEVCYLYSDIDCAGTASAPITFPGYSNLGKIGFDKLAQSWKCWRTDNVTASTSTTSSMVPTAPPPSIPESPAGSTSTSTLTTTSETTITITVSIPTSTSSSPTSWPTTATTDDPKLPTTDDTITSMYSTVTGLGPQMSPVKVTHTYANGSTVLTTLYKRADEDAVSTTWPTAEQKYICTTHYGLETYVSIGCTSSLTTSYMTMWYRCPSTPTVSPSPTTFSYSRL